jgi:hypothetical protein
MKLKMAGAETRYNTGISLHSFNLEQKKNNFSRIF